jgi:hypothetical protein
MHNKNMQSNDNEFISAAFSQYNTLSEVDCVLNVMAHAQKPDFVFRRNGQVHLNLREGAGGSVQWTTGSPSSCAHQPAGFCTARASLCSAVMWRLLVTHSIILFPLHFSSLPARHRVPSHFNWTLTICCAAPGVAKTSLWQFRTLEQYLIQTIIWYRSTSYTYQLVTSAVSHTMSLCVCANTNNNRGSFPKTRLWGRFCTRHSACLYALGTEFFDIRLDQHFKSRIKSYLLIAGIISSPFSPR